MPLRARGNGRFFLNWATPWSREPRADEEQSTKRLPPQAETGRRSFLSNRNWGLRNVAAILLEDHSATFALAAGARRPDAVWKVP